MSSTSPSTGGEWEQHTTGRLPGGSLRGHFAVAHRWGSLSHPHPEASWGSQAGDQRSAAPVPCGSQHARLSQHATQPCPLLSGGEAALGLFGLWSRAWLPQLGSPLRAGAQRGAGVPHVPGGGSIRAAVAGLRGSFLCGHGCAHTRLCAMRTRVFGEVGEVLVRDPSSSWHSRLPRRLPLLRHPAQSPSGLLQTNLPGPGGLSGMVRED